MTEIKHVRPSVMTVPNTMQVIRNEFGYSVKRISVHSAPTVKDKGNFAIRAHAYATRYPWSHDNKYFMTYEGSSGICNIHDGNSGLYIRTIDHGMREVQWLNDGGQPALMGFQAGRFVKYNFNFATGGAIAHTGTTTLVPNVAGYSVGNSEGSVITGLDDITRVLLTEKASSDNGDLNCYLVALYPDSKKTVNTTKLTLKDVGEGFDTATVSASGKFIVATSKTRGTLCYDVRKRTHANGNIEPVRISKTKHHGCVTTDIEGKDVLVQTNVIVNGKDRVVMCWDLESGIRRIVYGSNHAFTNDHESEGLSLSGHIGPSKRGYVVGSFSTDEQGSHICALIPLSGSEKIVVIGYTYAPSFGYYSQAHAVGRKDGEMVALVIPFKKVRCCGYIYTPNEAELYIGAPATTLLPLPAAPPVIAPVVPSNEADDLNTKITTTMEKINVMHNEAKRVHLETEKVLQRLSTSATIAREAIQLIGDGLAKLEQLPKDD